MHPLGNFWLEALPSSRIHAMAYSERGMKTNHVNVTETLLALPLEDVRAAACGKLPEDRILALMPPEVQSLHEKLRKKIGRVLSMPNIGLLTSETREFFGVAKADEITPGMLLAAREAHRIGQPKSYEVVIKRVVTETVRIQVEDATNEYDAHRQALQMAPDINPNHWSVGEEEFSIERATIEDADEKKQPTSRPSRG